MTKEAVILFKLIRIALGKEEPSSLINDVNWQDVYDLSLKQGVGAIACDGMLALKECGIDEELRYKWMGQSMVIEQKAQNQWRSLCQLSDLFAKYGIRTNVLKGFSYASFYPIPLHRSSTDVDICLLSDFEKGNQIIENTGVDVDRSESKHSHFTYNGVHVENHQFCVGVKGNKINKKIESFLQSLLEEDGGAIDNTNLTRPNWLFNAFFFMCHARTHFLIEEGITLKNVCDWILLKVGKAPDVDMAYFWAKCEEFGLMKFARAIDEVAEYVIGETRLSDTGYQMLQAIFSVKLHQHSKNKMMAHWNILRMIWSNRWKYPLFSDTTPLGMIAEYVYGFLFERKINQHDIKKW